MLDERHDLKLQVNISERMKADIEKIMGKRGMTQSQVVRMMIDLGIEVHNDLSRIGVVRVVDFFTSCKKALEMLDDPSSIQVVDDTGKVI